MTQKQLIDNYACSLTANPASSRVAYVIYPDVSVFTEAWLDDMAARCRASIVIIYIPTNCWDDLLTPWTAPGVPRGCPPFGGKAAEFYAELTEKIIPDAERTLAIANITERDLIGVSLAGLFTLWQWMQYDTFSSIACLSGSFWYDGFLDWFDAHPIPAKRGKAYFLLGTDEPNAKVKAFRPVAQNTQQIVDRLTAAHIPTHYDRVAGNHFANPVPRATRALLALLT